MAALDEGSGVSPMNPKVKMRVKRIRKQRTVVGALRVLTGERLTV